MRGASPAPNSLFRETIRYPSSGERKYIRYLDGRGHFAHVSLQLVPHPGETCSISLGEACFLPAQAIAAAEGAITGRFDGGRQSRLLFIGFEVRILGGSWLPSTPIPMRMQLQHPWPSMRRCDVPRR